MDRGKKVCVRACVHVRETERERGTTPDCRLTTQEEKVWKAGRSLVGRD